jgi:hypothetical protein
MRAWYGIQPPPSRRAFRSRPGAVRTSENQFIQISIVNTAKLFAGRELVPAERTSVLSSITSAGTMTDLNLLEILFPDVLCRIYEHFEMAELGKYVLRYCSDSCNDFSFRTTIFSFIDDLLSLSGAITNFSISPPKTPF